MKIHNVIFRTGYVEDTSNASVALHNYDGFDAVEGALRSISEALLEAYEKREEYFATAPKECCEQYHVDQFSYCGDCGTSLEGHITDRGDIESFVQSYIKGTVIEPSETWDALSVRGWYPFGYDDQHDFSNVVIVNQSAEIGIARMAMGEAMFYDDREGRYSDEFYRSYISMPDDAKLFMNRE